MCDTSEDGEARFKQPKTLCKEHEFVEKDVPLSTKYKNKLSATIFGELEISRSVIAMINTRSHNFLPVFKKRYLELAGGKKKTTTSCILINRAP